MCGVLSCVLILAATSAFVGSRQLPLSIVTTGVYGGNSDRMFDLLTFFFLVDILGLFYVTIFE